MNRKDFHQELCQFLLKSLSRYAQAEFQNGNSSFRFLVFVQIRTGRITEIFSFNHSLNSSFSRKYSIGENKEIYLSSYCPTKCKTPECDKTAISSCDKQNFVILLVTFHQFRFEKSTDFICNIFFHETAPF